MANFNLAAAQNPDGGWAFHGRASCTEPTALAALALRAASNSDGEEYRRAVKWLRSMQRPDGGWKPMQNVDQSTWVTSLALLVPAAELGQSNHDRGVEWLLNLQGNETTFLYRTLQRLHGRATPPEEVNAGWPWFPGAAAWVGSTSMAILALTRGNATGKARDRVEEGRRFLLARRCVDGGWNHGSVRALGFESGSYPEMTGLALLALKGVAAETVAKSIACAKGHLETCRSVEAASWLRMGLRAHGIEARAKFETECHDARDRALQMLAEMPAERNPFL